MKCLSVEEMRLCDEKALKTKGFTPELLMEQAAQAFAHLCMSRFDVCVPAVVLTGKGNNGGDGWAVARILKIHGYDVKVLELFPPGTPEGNFHKQLAEKNAVKKRPSFSDIPPKAFIVDAVFGTGFQGELPGDVKKCFNAVIEAGLTVAALDIPSGVNGNTGQAASGALRATLTGTFEYPKYAHFINEGRFLKGELHVLPIGVSASPEEEKNMFFGNLPEAMTVALPVPADDAHKYTRGAVQIIGGAPPYSGAPLLAARGALRAGAGYACVDTLDGNVLSGMPEIVRVLHADWENVSVNPKCRIVLAGPGMGRNEKAAGCLQRLFQEEEAFRLVLDADALFLFNDYFVKGRHEVIMTPHWGEFSAMTGVPVEKIQREMIPLGRAFARENGVVLVLKSPGTVVFYPDGRFFFNPAGNSYLSTLGSGDVLAGMIAALWAAGWSAEEAALKGVILHSRAGDRLVKNGKVNFTATEIADILSTSDSE